MSFLSVIYNSEFLGIPDYNTKLTCIYELVKSLPPPNHDTMKLLFGHLRRYGQPSSPLPVCFKLLGDVSRWRKWRDIILPLCDRVIHYGDNNRMTVQNVAIVFGPTLLRPETESANITMFMVFQNQIVEFILNEYERIFHWGWMCSNHLHWRLHATCTGPFCARNTWEKKEISPRKVFSENMWSMCIAGGWRCYLWQYL